MSAKAFRPRPSQQFALELLTRFVHGQTAAGCGAGFQPASSQHSSEDAGWKPAPQPAELDWPWIADFCRVHRLGPIFKKELAGAGVPGPLLEEWRASELRNFAWISRALPVVAKTLALLEAGGVPAVAMRGLVLSQTLYPRPELRSMTDADLLIKPDDVIAAEQALGRAGFQPEKRLRSQLVYRILDTAIEIHYSFLTPKRYRKTLTPAEFVADRQALALAPGTIYHLPPERELLGIIAHAFIHHDLFAFPPLIDAALLVLKRPELDWKYLARLSKSAGLERMVVFTLTLIDELFQLGLSPQPLELFSGRLPRRLAQTHSAYLAQLLGDDDWRHYLRRQRNLFFVAEAPETKLRQVLRWLSGDELERLRGVLRKSSPRDGA